MSNLISVPRELLREVVECSEAYTDISDSCFEELRALLAKPAEQHQGADTPPKDSAGALADALESSDWPGVSIGNKVLIAAAIQHLRARQSDQPAPVAVVLPEPFCRQRLAAEGKPYPRSSCGVCGPFSPKWRECDALIEIARLNPRAKP